LLKDGDFEAYAKTGGSAICFAWFIWEKAIQAKQR